MKNKSYFKAVLFSFLNLVMFIPGFLSAANPETMNGSQSPEVSVLPDSAVQRMQSSKQGFQNFFLGGFIGYGYRTAGISGNVSSAERSYLENLLGGIGVGGNLNYFVNERYGIGLRYSRFHSSNSISNYSFVVQTPNGPATLVGEMSDNISIEYYSAVFEERYVQRNRKGFFLLGVDLGYMHYLDEGALIVPAKIDGNAFGLGLLLAYHYFINSDISCGANFSYEAGSMRSYDFTFGGATQHVNLDPNNYESLAFLTIGVSLNYHF